MSKSVKRVEDRARDLGLDIVIRRMPDSTRTAEEAAIACGCALGQIVKSLIFEGADSGDLKLVLVAGDKQADSGRMRGVIGEDLKRADVRKVREITGFAIGGVAPIGHLTEIATFMDESFFRFATVWAAAGAPNAVFEATPEALKEVTGATLVAVS
ncbi:MAG: YbaK/EbsC family protein [Pseudomonadota bacterium]